MVIFFKNSSRLRRRSYGFPGPIPFFDDSPLVLRRSSGREGTQAGAPMRRCPNNPMGKGFTLIEMMIVISIVGILVSIAIPVYQQHVLRAREAVLKEDLYTMRTSIDQYTNDKNKAPQSLDDLVSSGYMHLIPKDPFTESNTTWQTASDDSIQQLDQTDTGIVDVHSGSKAVSSDGTSYDTW